MICWMAVSGARSLSRRPLGASHADQALFVDREVERDAIGSALELALNVFVAGPAGSGKTSLLRHLQRRLADLDQAVVYANVEPARSVAEALVLFARAIDPEGRAPLARALSPTIDARSWGPTVAFDDSDLVVIEEAVATRPEEEPLVVLVDGISDSTAATVFGHYRDRLWETSQLRWIVASRRPGPPTPADAFFDRVIELTPFPQAAGLELLAARLPDLDPQLRARLAAAIGTAQPVSWVLAAQSLAVGTTPAETVIDIMAQQATASTQLPERLQVLYEAIAELGPVHAGDDALLARVGTSRPSVVTGLKELEQAGLVRAERDGRRVLYNTQHNRMVHTLIEPGHSGHDLAITAPDGTQTIVEVKRTRRRR